VNFSEKACPKCGSEAIWWVDYHLLDELEDYGNAKLYAAVVILQCEECGYVWETEGTAVVKSSVEE